MGDILASRGAVLPDTSGKRMTVRHRIWVVLSRGPATCAQISEEITVDFEVVKNQLSLMRQTKQAFVIHGPRPRLHMPGVEPSRVDMRVKNKLGSLCRELGSKAGGLKRAAIERYKTGQLPVSTCELERCWGWK